MTQRGSQHRATILADERRICGWREWASLPGLGIGAIKAKLDTGAKTSALHAWDLDAYEVDGRPWVRFCVHPLHRADGSVARCSAPLCDRRWVTNSGGTSERRYVISTHLRIGAESWPIELTLTNREQMGFRLLIGREAMRGHLIVDPNSSYRAGKPGGKVKKSTKTQLVPNRKDALYEDRHAGPQPESLQP